MRREQCLQAVLQALAVERLVEHQRYGRHRRIVAVAVRVVIVHVVAMLVAYVVVMVVVVRMFVVVSVRVRLDRPRGKAADAEDLAEVHLRKV
ncbi:hypothetical protein D3C87_1801260 [compost metagenome]